MIKKTTTILGIASIGFILASSVIFGYVFNNIYTAMAKTAELAAEAQNATKTVGNITGLNKAVITSRTEREFLDSLFVDTDDISDTLQFLEQFGIENNVNLKIQTVVERVLADRTKKKTKSRKVKKKKQGPIGEIVVSLGVDGQLNEIVDFIQSLEKSSKAIYIENTHIVEEVESGDWHAQFKIVFLTVHKKQK